MPKGGLQGKTPRDYTKITAKAIENGAAKSAGSNRKSKIVRLDCIKIYENSDLRGYWSLSRQISHQKYTFSLKFFSIWAQDGRSGDQDGAKLARRATQMEPGWTASLDFCRLDWTSLYWTRKKTQKMNLTRRFWALKSTFRMMKNKHSVRDIL